MRIETLLENRFCASFRYDGSNPALKSAEFGEELKWGWFGTKIGDYLFCYAFLVTCFGEPLVPEPSRSDRDSCVTC